MFQCLLPRVLLTWSLLYVEGPTVPWPNLGLIHRASPPFSKCIWCKGVTFWVPTHVPQPLVTRPGSVSTFLSYHAHGSPLGVALSWFVSVLGVSQRGRGYFTSQVTPHWYWEYGLEATSLFSLLLFWGTETSRGVAPSTVFPTRGYRGVTPSMSYPGDALTWRRLTLATAHLGDAYPWRRLRLATP